MCDSIFHLVFYGSRPILAPIIYVCPPPISPPYLHDVVIAVPVSSFVLLHSTVLVGFHAGKVPADGPLTLARIQARIVRSGSGGRLPVHRRHRTIGLGRRQRRHLSEQISQVIHRGVAVWRCELWKLRTICILNWLKCPSGQSKLNILNSLEQLDGCLKVHHFHRKLINA